MRFLTIIFCAVVVLFSLHQAQAEVPKLINYQGKLTTAGGACVDTTVSMQFAIYSDSTDGDLLWTETQSSVKVSEGIFNVLLGSETEIPDSVFTGGIRYLGVKVGDDPEMIPRKSIVSVGYAYNSDKVDGKHASELEGISPNQVYESEWFQLEPGVYCYEKMHNLGTKKLFTFVYYAWPDSTSNPTLVPLAIQNQPGGVLIGAVTDTEFCMCFLTRHILFMTTCNSYIMREGGWLKVIAIALP